MSIKKRCKGNHYSSHYPGCGEMTILYKYNLCRACFNEWVYSTGEGSEWLQKRVIPKAKKDVKQKQKEQDNKLREKIETLSEVQKKLQKEINKIVRLIDKGHPCISSGRPLGKSYDAGHFYSIGSNPQIRFHLFNNFAQSVEQNQWKSGNPLGYVEGLENTFGEDLKNYCLSLKSLPALKLSKEELREKTDKARSIVKWLKLQDRTFSLEERIILRKRFNNELGIY